MPDDALDLFARAVRWLACCFLCAAYLQGG
jgi:hypothetical protein